MTYAPQRLLDLRDYLQDRTGLPAVSLGIVGSGGHHRTGTSYHIGWSSLRADAYSRQHPRDTKLRTDAASASDTGEFSRGGKTLVGLTMWAVAEARAGRRPDTRELIGPWSDGRAYRWAAENGWRAQLRSRGDSHETHLHESWYRDSEHDDKIGYYRGYFEEDDMPSEREVWRWREGHDYVNEKTSSKDHQLARAHEYSYEARNRLREDLPKIGEQLEAIAAAVGGDSHAAVLERIDAHHAEQMAAIAAQDEALARAVAEREELAELVRQGQSGERDAAEIVDEIARRLAGDGDGT